MFEQFFRWYLALGASDLTAVLLSLLLILTYLNLRYGFGSQPLLLYPPG